MRRYVVTSVVVVASMVAIGFAVVHWGGRYVANNVVLPRLERRLDVVVRREAVRTSLGSVTIASLSVDVRDVPELTVSIREIRIEYGLWALFSGDLQITRVFVEEPAVSLSSFDADVEARLLGALGRVREAAAGSPVSSVGPSAVTPEVAARDGRLDIRNFLGASLEVRGGAATLAWDGTFEVGASEWAVRGEGLPRPLIAGGQVEIVGAREGGGRVAIDEVRLAGLEVEWSNGSDGSRAAEAFARALRGRLAGVGAGSASAEAAGAGESGRGSRFGVTLPGRVVIASSHVAVDVPGPAGEARRRLAIDDVEGRVLLGSDTEAPSAVLSGILDPGGGHVEIEVGVGSSADHGLRARVQATGISIGRVAAGFSVSGFAFEEGSSLDADVTVERGSDGQVAFRGEASTAGISFREPLVATEPVAGLRVRAAARGEVDPQLGSVTVDTATLWINGVELSASGRLTRASERLAFDVVGALRPVHCGVLLQATPEALRDRLDGLVVDGVISGTIRLAVDTADVENLVLDVDLRNGCRATGRGLLDIERLHGAFTHRVELPDDEVFEFRTGPGSGSWASLEEISPFLVSAVLTTEDGRFFQHNGFNIREIRRALIRDIESGHPRFGASTISMQLARNLYLYRRRTLARKLQEAVLTWYLEQNLSKEQILTLYLNVIENGPEIFGVRRAAMHYFGRQPDDLSAREAVLLAKLLPAPVRSHEQTYEAGELGPTWNGRLDRALRVMRDRRMLTAEEYRAGLEQRIVFHRSGDSLPLHRSWRPRGMFPHRGGDEDEASPERWLEVESEAEIPAPDELLEDE